MAVFGVRLYCFEQGTSLISVNLVGQRSGSNNDNFQLRIIRRRSGFADKILASEPFLALTADKTAHSWVWVDDNVPSTGEWDYVLQIKKLDGNGSFYEMLLSGVHYKR